MELKEDYGLYKSARFYSDTMHGDHLEAYRNNTSFKVMNLDGSTNAVETAETVGRGILR